MVDLYLMAQLQGETVSRNNATLNTGKDTDLEYEANLEKLNLMLILIEMGK